MVPGGKDGEGIVRESGMDMDTLLYLTWRTSKDLLDSTGDPAQCHVAAWLEGSLRGMGTCVWTAEPLCYPPEATTSLLIAYTPIRNKKFNNNKSHQVLSHGHG